MAFTSGEHIEKFVLPRIIHELRNLKMDFMSVMEQTPQRAITSAGVTVHKIGQPIQVDWNKADAYVDGDLKQFAVENDTIPWDYLSTTPFTTDKEEIRTSALNRRGILLDKSLSAISESWRDKTLHNLAPADDSVAEMPVMVTTGADRGAGVRALTITDLIRWAEKFNNLNLSMRDQVYVVLCPEHVTDLALDALNYQQFRDIYSKSKEGEPIDTHGFKFFWNNKKVYYTAALTKKADGAAIIGTDRPASIAFYKPHTTKALYNLTAHYSPMSQDTRNNPPKDETRFTGNALGTKIYNYGHGALISGTV